MVLDCLSQKQNYQDDTNKFYDLWIDEEIPQAKDDYNNCERTIFYNNLIQNLGLPGLSQNPNLTIDLVKQTANESWVWDEYRQILSLMKRRILSSETKKIYGNL